MRRIGLVAAGMVVMVVSACGGGSSGGSAGRSATTSSSPAALPTAAAQGAAKAGLLSLSDFPSGWKSSPSNNNQDSKAFETKVANCLHVSPTLLGGGSGAHADSPDFNSPESPSATVSETISIDTNAHVDEGFAVLQSPRLISCIDSLIGAFLQQELAKSKQAAGAKLGQPHTSPLSLPTIGQESAAFAFTVPVTVSGQTVNVYVDFVFIRDKNAVAQLSFEHVFTSFDLTTAESIARKAYTKLNAVTIPAA